MRLAARWAVEPPAHPVIVAGSTGSRGTTALLMQAVARLPQGAVVLPGFDGDMPAHGLGELADALTAEDHPQFRFRALFDAVGADPGDVRTWVAQTGAESGSEPADFTVAAAGAGDGSVAGRRAGPA